MPAVLLLGVSGRHHLCARTACFTSGVFLFASGCLPPRSGEAGEERERNAPVAPACTDSLEPYRDSARCPARFSPATDGPNELCTDYYDTFHVGNSSRYAFINYQYGAGESECVYDAQTSELVGIWVADDYDHYCGSTSSSIELGDVGHDGGEIEMSREIDCRDSDLAPRVGSPTPEPRACPGGSTPTFVALTSNAVPGNFTLSQSEVYWGEFYGVWHAPKVATNGERPVLEDDGGYRVMDSDPEALYWSKPPVWSSPPSVYRLPFGSRSEPVRVVDDASNAWAVSDEQVYYLSSNGQLRSVLTAGGDSTLLAEGAGSSEALAVDATGLYWYAEPAGFISKYTFTTGLVTAFAPVTGGARFVQTAGEHVLWVDAGGVWSSTWDGERRLLSSASSVRGLTSDGSRVYWAQSSGADVF
ncbi:MAG TPA: hypothetical protein VJU61_23315, partial [Polyangiaceae bacterium]|nr:hypothetical protein [Polyangiaceae bacterium]